MYLWLTLFTLVAVSIYIICLIFYINGRQKSRELDFFIDEGYHTEMKTFNFENVFLEKLQIKPDSIKPIIYLERVMLLAAAFVGFWFLRGLALAAYGAITIGFIFSDAYKKVIYESGITNIEKILNFINYFVPHINSGNSADQSFLGYIEYSGDEDLAAYYENMSNPDYILPKHLAQIVDIYDIAKYNEEKGISDYTYILNELSQDMAQKQIYYNSFVSRMGEIQPICWSYYLGVPILIAISFGQTYDFWFGVGGYVVSIILLVLFTIFKLLIYKLQKKTVNVIF